MSSSWKRHVRRFLARRWFTNASGLALSTTIRSLMSTLEYKALMPEPTIDPAQLSTESDQSYLYVFWHEYIPFYMYLRGHCDICMLLSTSRDGDLMARAAHHMGFESVRGSTRVNPISALRGMLRAGARGHLTITPDGPRGPHHSFSPGAIYLASKLQMPIVPLGLGYDRPWRLNSWDRFAIPRPYSRARCIAGPPIEVPTPLSRRALDWYQVACKELLDRLTVEAEAWAACGSVHDDEVALKKESRQRLARSVVVSSDAVTSMRRAA